MNDIYNGMMGGLTLDAEKNLMTLNIKLIGIDHDYFKQINMNYLAW